MRCLLAVLLVFLVTQAACDSFPPASELGDDNQVLAIRASPPELEPGGTVTLDALVHWPVGAPTLFWLICVPDVDDDVMTCTSNNLPESGMPALCADDPAARLCIAAIGDTATYTVPPDAFPQDGEQHTFFTYLLAADGPDGLLQCSDTLTGAPPTLGCLFSLKRIVVSSRAAPNQNPVVTALVVAGETVDPSSIAEVQTADADLEKHKIALGVTLDATSVDEILDTTSPGDEPVRLTLQWFSTCGEVADPIQYLDVSSDGAGGLTYDRELTQWKPQQSGECLVHAVVRDDQGGAGFLSQQLSVVNSQ